MLMFMLNRGSFHTLFFGFAFFSVALCKYMRLFDSFVLVFGSLQSAPNKQTRISFVLSRHRFNVSIDKNFNRWWMTLPVSFRKIAFLTMVLCGFEECLNGNSLYVDHFFDGN